MISLTDFNLQSVIVEDLVDLLINVLLGGQTHVRTVAAKALGSMVRHLRSTHACLQNLLDSLQTKLISSEISSVERSGIANGYAQVVTARHCEDPDQLNSHIINTLMPVLNTSNMDAHEGILWVFVYLPTSMSTNRFAPIMEASLPAMLNELALDKQALTETVMRAVRVLIQKQEVGDLLPPVLDGCGSRCENTRSCSIVLLGDILYQLAGEQDIVEKAEQNLAQALETYTHREVLSVVYFARSDGCAGVRSHALNVWKNVVSNTPRVLRQIMPGLTSLIVSNLASDDVEEQQSAARCLAELSTKLGDSIMRQVLPLFEDNLVHKSDLNMHRGVCIGLKEVIANLTKDNVQNHLSKLVSITRVALCSEDAVVRKLAAACFQSLYSITGSDVLESIVPNLLAQISTPSTHTRAINGLAQILSLRSVSRELLPYLIPRLLKRPLSTDNLTVLSSIAGVTGSTLHSHLHFIVPILVNAIPGSYDEVEKAIRDCIRSIFASVEDVRSLISEIVDKCSDESDDIRTEGCWMFGVIAEERKLWIYFVL